MSTTSIVTKEAVRAFPWTEYIPHQPTIKQTAFLMLPNHEAFYGGAAGGGKSDALLMAALQYVDVPGYCAILFRKTHTDLLLADSLLFRAHEWLQNTDARWMGGSHTYLFPSGAVLQFGYLKSELDKFRYQSAQYQFIGVDEITQHFEDDFDYLTSRLRRLSGSTVPLRVRTASNPGGVGHFWVKERYQIEYDPDYHDEHREGAYRGQHPDRPHIPAFVEDNPHLAIKEYKEQLSRLGDKVTREQLLRGDWGVSAEGRIRKGWMNYYTIRGEHIVMGNQPNSRALSFPILSCFSTVDPAASAREGPGDVDVFRSGAPSWTVICTWLLSADYHLFLWNMKRFRGEIPEVISAIRKEYHTDPSTPAQGKTAAQRHVFKPLFIAIEADGLGIGVYQILARSHLPVRKILTRSRDKLVRATDIINRIEAGKVWLPFPSEGRPWLDSCETELYTWTGHPDQPDDIIDAFAHAGNLIAQDAIPIETASTIDLPTSVGGREM